VLLETKGLTKYFGGLAAVSQLDMHVNQGEIVGLIGPNGAGKTTTFNLMTGIHRLTEGKIVFEGRNITGKKPHLIAKMGIGRTFQSASLFPDFTVLENVVASFYLYPKSGFWEVYVQYPWVPQERGIYLKPGQGNPAACGPGRGKG